MVLELQQFEQKSKAITDETIARWRLQLKEKNHHIAETKLLKKFSFLHDAAQQIATAHWNLGKRSEKTKWEPEQIRVTDVFYQKVTGNDSGVGDFRPVKSEGLLVISKLANPSTKEEGKIVVSTLYVPQANNQQDLILSEAFKDNRFWWDRVTLGIPGVKGVKKPKVEEVYKESLKGNRRSLRRLRVYENDEVYTRNYGFLTAILARVVDVGLVESFQKTQKIINSRVRKVDYEKESIDTLSVDYSHQFSEADNILAHMAYRLSMYGYSKNKLNLVNTATKMMSRADLGKLTLVR